MPDRQDFFAAMTEALRGVPNAHRERHFKLDRSRSGSSKRISPSQERTARGTS